MLGIAVPKAGLGLKLLLKATSTPAVASVGHNHCC